MCLCPRVSVRVHMNVHSAADRVDGHKSAVEWTDTPTVRVLTRRCGGYMYRESFVRARAGPQACRSVLLHAGMPYGFRAGCAAFDGYADVPAPARAPARAAASDG